MGNSSQTRNTSIPSSFQNSYKGRCVENHGEHDEAAFLNSLQSGIGNGSHPNRSPDMDCQRATTGVCTFPCGHVMAILNVKHESAASISKRGKEARGRSPFYDFYD